MAARSASRKRWLHCSAASSEGAERCDPTSTSISSGKRSSTRHTRSARQTRARRRGSAMTTLHTPAWSRPFFILSVQPSRQQHVMPLPPMALSRGEEEAAMRDGRARCRMRRRRTRAPTRRGAAERPRVVVAGKTPRPKFRRVPDDGGAWACPNSTDGSRAPRRSPLATRPSPPAHRRLHASSTAHRSERYPLINRPVSEANMRTTLSRTRPLWPGCQRDPSG